MDKLSRLVIDYVRGEGACAAGIVTTETLNGIGQWLHGEQTSVLTIESISNKLRGT